jgi:hypothetical protein
MASAKNKFVPVLTFKEFYGTLHREENALKNIAHFNLEDVIIALILIANDGERSFRSNIDVNTTLLNRLPPAKAARLRSFIEQREESRFRLSNSTVVAKIITDIYKVLPGSQPDNDTDNPVFEEILLDVILIYNERQYPDVGDGELINSHQMLWQLMLMQDLTGLTVLHYTRTANIKHLVFIQFLRETLGDSFQNVEDEFREHAGVESIYTFVVSIIQLYVAIERKYKDPASSLIWFEKEDTTYKLLQNFDLIYNQKTHAQAKFDVSFYVTHPFFEHSDGKIYLVDHNHFAFALDKGWTYYFFKASQVIKYLPQVNSFSDFQSYLGKNYYEQYLILGLLKILRRPGFRVIETDDKDLPDAAIVLNEKDVFLFEIKSSSLHYKIVNDKDTAGFQQFLDDNFAGEKKGAKQLSRTIQYLANDSKNQYNIKTTRNKINVYPIIVYTEQHLEKHAVNNYVNEKFKELIKDYQSPFREIKPLVMIHYDFFVENITLLESRPSLLKSALEHYISFTRKSAAAYKKTGENMDYLRSMVSFDKYIIKFQGLYLLDQKKIFSNIARIFKMKGE